MGYRGKFITEDYGLELEESFVDKYSHDYHFERNFDGKAYLNITSRDARKEHFDIISDLQGLLKDNPYHVWAAILWEDGRLTRIRLNTSEEYDVPPED